MSSQTRGLKLGLAMALIFLTVVGQNRLWAQVPNPCPAGLTKTPVEPNPWAAQAQARMLPARAGPVLQELAEQPTAAAAMRKMVKFLVLERMSVLEKAHCWEEFVRFRNQQPGVERMSSERFQGVEQAIVFRSLEGFLLVIVDDRFILKGKDPQTARDRYELFDWTDLPLRVIDANSTAP